MKKTVAVATAIAVLTITASSSLAAVQPDLSDPYKVITAYLNAKKSGNVELMEQYSIDNRYDDASTQSADLKNDYQTNPLLSYTILSSQQTDDTHMVFNVQETFKNGGQIPPLPLELVKDHGKWQYFVESFEINSELNSPDYGKVLKKNVKFQKDTSNTSLITPNTTTAVLYWSFTGLMSGTSKFSSSQFNQSRSDGQVTLNGWQENGHGTAYVTYAAVTKYDSVTWKTWGSVPVGPLDYYSSGDWYTAYIQGVPYGTGYNLLFTNSGNYNVSSSGNAYE